MLLIPRLPIALPRILKPQRVTIDGSYLDIQRAWQLAVEWCPSTLIQLNERVVGGADLHLVGIEDRDGQAVVARVGAGTLIHLILNNMHATPAGSVAASDILSWVGHLN